MSLPDFQFDFQNPEGNLLPEATKLLEEARSYMEKCINVKTKRIQEDGLSFAYKQLINATADFFIVINYLGAMPDSKFTFQLALALDQMTTISSMVISPLLLEMVKEKKEKEAKAEIEALNLLSTLEE